MNSFVLSKLLKYRNRRKNATNEKSNKMRYCRGRSSREWLHDRNSLDWLAFISVLVAATAVALAALCTTAGSIGSMQKDYAIFTLNTSRIGQNMKQDIDHDIMAIHIKRNLQRLAAPNNALAPSATATTLITVAPRVPDLVGAATSELHGVKSSIDNGIKSDASHAASVVHGGVSSVESGIRSATSQAVGAVQSEAVKLVNEAFDQIISGFNLSDFYAVSLQSTCSGLYVTGDKDTPVSHTDSPTNGTKINEKIEKCEQHGAADPMSWMKWVYAGGAIATGIELVLAIFGVIWQSRKWAFANISMAGIAFCIIFAATGVTQGVTLGVIKGFNTLAEYTGVSANVGQNFFGLAWASAALNLVNMMIWAFILWRI